MILAIVNSKGGVGKTTACLNLGAALAERGRNVLLVDCDHQASLTVSLGQNPSKLKHTICEVMLSQATIAQVTLNVKPKIDLVPSSVDLAGVDVLLLGELGRERILSEKLAKDNHDYVLLDCPPSFGVMTINALTAADFALIPTQTSYLSFQAMQHLFAVIEKVQARSNSRLRVKGILPTFVDNTSHSKEMLSELKRSYKDYLIDIPIRRRVGLSDASVSGQSVLEFDPKSDAAEAYRKLAEVVDA